MEGCPQDIIEPGGRTLASPTGVPSARTDKDSSRSFWEMGCLPLEKNDPCGHSQVDSGSAHISQRLALCCSLPTTLGVTTTGHWELMVFLFFLHFVLSVPSVCLLECTHWGKRTHILCLSPPQPRRHRPEDAHTLIQAGCEHGELCPREWKIMQCQARRSGPVGVSSCHWAGIVSGTAIFELLQVSGSPEAGLSSDRYPSLYGAQTGVSVWGRGRESG